MASSKPCYKLSRELLGHTDEVRSLSVFKDGSVVSTSRDKTTRFWKVTKMHSNERPYGFSMLCMRHRTYQKNPTGFIVTGGNDKNICIYYPGENNPIHTISGHENTVSCLKASVVNNEFFLSCSLDHTGKLWDMYDLERAKSVFLGHAPSTSIWCIADLLNGYVVTGGSDNIVTVYARNGRVLHRLNGHMACVRDIAVVNAHQFLTCGNDAMTKHWDANNGTCLGTYTGHTSHIYSVSTLFDGSLAVSCGEDKTVRVWRNAVLDQTIALPAETIWSVALLPNEDLVCGSSDGAVRIFTVNEQRYIDSKAMQKFKLAVLERIKHSKANRDMQTDEKTTFLFQTPELSQPGEADGDTVIVKEQDKVKAYEWSQREFQWKFIGDVVENKEPTTGKTTYNGIEYDYVFSVDVEEGAPLLKLPYNRGQDPYAAAQQFIHDNNLNPGHVNKIAKFITTNLQVTPILNAESQYTDPFTGGHRYISNSLPSSSSASITNTLPPENSLTGQSYIPQTSYLKLEQGNITVIHKKLKEFNGKNEERIGNIPDEKLESVVGLITNTNPRTIEEEVNNLKALLNWPDDVVFPVLDIARLVVLQKDVNEMFCTKGTINLFKRHLQKDAKVSNQMLAYRLLANLFSHEAGERFCMQCRNEVLTTMRDLTEFGNKNNEVAISTYILNLSVALNKSNDVLGKVQTLSIILKLLEHLKEAEAVFRILVALGSLIVGATNDHEKNGFVNSVRQSKNVHEALGLLLDGVNYSNVPHKFKSITKQILELIKQ